MANGGRPVKYGQCWVFSAVVATSKITMHQILVCRAIGLPCRSVSNFVSGHDTNQSLTIDKFYAKNGKRMEGLRRPAIGHNDSIWNFHVWDEVFMARPDLPRGYGGWQAIDATPQEVSDSKNSFCKICFLF